LENAGIGNAILCQNLTKKYGDVEVLKGVNLKIEESEFYALMGPNGSGKTTLTSIIAAVKLPTSGRVEIYGKPPENAKVAKRKTMDKTGSPKMNLKNKPEKKRTDEIAITFILLSFQMEE